ncbi:MAG: hypothetical protein WC764_02680 [Candidatus Paceibacterota bacterium]|jgi:hypothetical protein
MEKETNNELESRLEIMPTPEVVVQDEPGMRLWGIAQKAADKQYDKKEYPIVEDIEDYFSERPLPRAVIQKIQEYQKVNEEAVFWISLAYNHLERIDLVKKEIISHKSWITNIDDLINGVHAVMREVENSLDADIQEKIQGAVLTDLSAKERIHDQLTADITEIINFYKLSPETNIKQAVLTTANFFTPKNSGRGLSVGEDQYLFCHATNRDNMRHEFSHGFINDMVHELDQKLFEEQKNKIVLLAGDWLKYGNDYGEYWESLLDEELIRTYVDCYSKRQQLKMTPLRTLVYKLYEDYDVAKETDPQLRFKQFLLTEFPKRLW